jgi:hypothetical protein
MFTPQASAIIYKNLGLPTADVVDVVLSVVLASLSLLVARGCGRGRQWSRLAGTILFALATLVVIGAAIDVVKFIWRGGTLGSLPARWWAPIGLILLIWLVALTALVALWSQESRAYFRASVAVRTAEREERRRRART